MINKYMTPGKQRAQFLPQRSSRAIDTSYFLNIQFLSVPIVANQSTDPQQNILNFNTEFAYAAFTALRKMGISVKNVNTFLMLLKHVNLKKAHSNKPKSTNHTE